MSSNNHGRIKLLTGRAHPELASRVATELEIDLVKTKITEFGNGEIYARVKEDVRGCDVFFLSSLHAHKGGDAFIETLLLIDCIRNSAGRITGIFPFIGYAKQDRRTKARESRSFLTIANLLSACGLHRVVLFDIHNQATADFFSIPSDHVYLMRLLIDEFKRRNPKNAVIVSPDIGSGKRADAVARLTDHFDVCIVWKIHDPDTKEIDFKKTKIFGNVEDKTVWIFDDMVQSFKTVDIAAKVLKQKGAKKIVVAAVHPDFTSTTIDCIDNSVVDEVIVVDTIPHRKAAIGWSDKITVLNPSRFIAKCIKLVHEDGQLSPLFLQY